MRRGGGGPLDPYLGCAFLKLWELGIPQSFWSKQMCGVILVGWLDDMTSWGLDVKPIMSHVSHEKNLYYFPLCWLVDWDPYSGTNYNPYTWEIFDNVLSKGLENVFVKLFQVGPYDRYKCSELNPISRVKEPQLPINIRLFIGVITPFAMIVGAQPVLSYCNVAMAKSHKLQVHWGTSYGPNPIRSTSASEGYIPCSPREEDTFTTSISLNHKSM